MKPKMKWSDRFFKEMNSLCSQYKTKRETKWKMKRSEKTKQSEKWSNRLFSPASFGQNKAQNETNGTKEPASALVFEQFFSKVTTTSPQSMSKQFSKHTVQKLKLPWYHTCWNIWSNAFHNQLDISTGVEPSTPASVKLKRAMQCASIQTKSLVALPPHRSITEYMDCRLLWLHKSRKGCEQPQTIRSLIWKLIYC